MPANVLYYGDNLDVLRRHVPAEFVDPFRFQAWALGLVGARVAGSDK